jgi:hypothetical protein
MLSKGFEGRQIIADEIRAAPDPADEASGQAPPPRITGPRDHAGALDLTGTDILDKGDCRECMTS